MGFGKLVTEKIILRSKTKFDVSQVLTAEQQAQLEEIRDIFKSDNQNPVDASTSETP